MNSDNSSRGGDESGAGEEAHQGPAPIPFHDAALTERRLRDLLSAEHADEISGLLLLRDGEPWVSLQVGAALRQALAAHLSRQTRGNHGEERLAFLADPTNGQPLLLFAVRVSADTQAVLVSKDLDVPLARLRALGRAVKGVLLEEQSQEAAEGLPEEQPASEMPAPVVHGLSAESAPSAPVQPPRASEPAEKRTEAAQGPVRLSLDAFEPSWLALSALSYTFLFVPRLPGHLLQGGLAEKLQAWLGELCRVYDWELQFVRIQAQCFEWTVRARPEVAPRDVMLVFRQRTSNLVFASFPELRYQSATDDFWADGCLVISGTGPLPQSLCLDYIRAVREHRLGSGRAP